jgi:tetrahydromethanopterin S-methyltransferase subunit H
MASITLSVVGCVDYLAYGTIFTCAMFLPKIKLDVFFSARKAVDAACREVVRCPICLQI